MNFSRLVPLLLSSVCLAQADSAFAQWSLETESNLFDTNAVSYINHYLALEQMIKPAENHSRSVPDDNAWLGLECTF